MSSGCNSGVPGRSFTYGIKYKAAVRVQSDLALVAVLVG